MWHRRPLQIDVRESVDATPLKERLFKLFEANTFVQLLCSQRAKRPRITLCCSQLCTLEAHT